MPNTQIEYQRVINAFKLIAATKYLSFIQIQPYHKDFMNAALTGNTAKIEIYVRFQDQPAFKTITR